MIAYRVDRRTFVENDQITVSGQYCADLQMNDPDRAKVECYLAQKSCGPDRCELLHVFAHENSARAYWWKVANSSLYEVEVDEALIRHRGDMMFTEQIYNARDDAAAALDLAGQYWAGKETSTPCIEILANYVTVIRVCGDDNQRRADLAKKIGYGG